MAEPFNVEQFRQQQQMAGQVPQAQPQVMPAQASPQPYQPAPMQQSYAQPAQMEHMQTQPSPYQVQPQPNTQPIPQQYVPPHYQGHTQPAPAQQMPPQTWSPQVQETQHPHMMQPQTPVHHMPPPPVFAPPPSAQSAVEEVEAPFKKSRFSFKRGSKVKTPKVKKNKAGKADKVATADAQKTSPAMTFMFGMATGIVCFLLGNMAMSSLLSDNTAQDFKDIQNQNAQAQQLQMPPESP